MQRTLIVAAMVTMLAPAAALADPCQMGRVGEIAVTWDNNRPLAPIEINGHDVQALIDIGADHTAFFRNGADRLGLEYGIVAGRTAYGFGGAARIYSTRVAQLTLAGETATGVRLDVLDYNWPGRRDIALTLGQNLLSAHNLELDFTAGKLTFYQTRGDCDQTALAYWSETWSALDMLERRPSGSVRIEVQLNGQTMRALLDTGAPTSLVTREAAQRLGVTQESEEVIAESTTSGVGGRQLHAWLGRFDKVEMGGETVNHPLLRIVDTDAPGASHADFDMVLGADFFRSHRVMLAYSQHKVYFAYLGGRIFQSVGPIALPVPETAPEDAPH